MKEVWARIEQWLSTNAPPVQRDLLPPATDADIEALESQIKATLPSKFRESTMIHDGQKGRYRLAEPWVLLPLARMIIQVQRMSRTFSDANDEDEPETRGAVKPMWWNAAWVPFAADGAGGLLCFDFDPALGGNSGQVIQWAADPPFIEVIAQNFQAWLKQFADDLFDGKFEWDSENEEWFRVQEDDHIL